MINVTGLSKRYGSHLAVNNVSFDIDKGEVIGFLGPNGAGKSTIMNILTGYLSMTRGEVLTDGFNIAENPEEAKKRIGYLPEMPPLYTDMKVREYLNFIYDLKKVKFPKKPHIDEVLRLVGITAVEGRLIKNLSKGYRQRVGFAQALIGNPDVLILDEPTVGLDPKQIIEIRNLIAKLGKNHTIILSSHILSEIQAVCKRLIIINRGEIVADDTPENLSNKLSSDRSLVARIICDETSMVNVLKTVRGVASVTSMGATENGAYDFRIVPVMGEDVRADVFSKIVDSGKTLLSFTDNSMSVEQVFLKLTDCDAASARKLLGSAKKETDNAEATDRNDADNSEENSEEEE